MRIVVAAVGRLKQGPETELSARFRKRAAQTGRNLGLRDVEIVEIRESRADDPNKRMLAELIALANIIPQGAAVVLLDAHGDNLDSASLAAQLSKWRRDDRPAAVFMIGGADGLAPSLCAKAELRLAFGAATGRTSWCASCCWNSFIAPPRSSPVTRIIGHDRRRSVLIRRQ